MAKSKKGSAKRTAKAKRGTKQATVKRPTASRGTKTAATKNAVTRKRSGPVAWVAVPDPAREGEELQVGVPARSSRPTAADRDEAAYSVETLDDNRQLSRSGTLGPGETHAVEETPEGERRVVRKRFSTI